MARFYILLLLINVLGCFVGMAQESKVGLPLEVNVDVTDVTCFDESTGSAVVTATGGTKPYKYHWNHIQHSDTISCLNDIESGVYYLTVSDAAGNTKAKNVIVNQPTNLHGIIATEQPSCNGGNDGELEIKMAGGTPPYRYFVDGLSINDSICKGLGQGSYSVTVLDSKNCHFDDLTYLIDIDLDCIRIPTVFSPNGDGVNDQWIIENIEQFHNFKVKVFNRWGQTLYEGDEYSEPWLGTTMSNQSLPAGSYMYIIESPMLDEPRTGIVSIVK